MIAGAVASGGVDGFMWVAVVIAAAQAGLASWGNFDVAAASTNSQVGEFLDGDV